MTMVGRDSILVGDNNIASSAVLARTRAMATIRNTSLCEDNSLASFFSLSRASSPYLVGWTDSTVE